MVKKKIGLAGKSGSGKDLVADYIGERYGYKKIAVADAIREEVEQFIQSWFGWLAVIAPVDSIITAFKAMVWEKPTHPAMRVLLQWWGTEFRRSQDSQYWTKILATKLANEFQIVISDIRTPEEMAEVRAAGGEVWFIERLGVAPVGMKNHLTEVALEGAEFDRTIKNDGTIQELFDKIDWLFRET